METIILASIVKLLWFALGYQTCRIIRKHKDQQFLAELYSAILMKLDETELMKNSKDNKNDIIKEGNQE